MFSTVETTSAYVLDFGRVTLTQARVLVPNPGFCGNN